MSYSYSCTAPLLFNILMSLLGVIIAFIPTEIYLFFVYLVGPQGFWQSFLVFGFGIWMFGAIQLFMILFLVAWLALLWND